MSFNLNVYWVSDYTESWNRARIMHDSSLYFVMPASCKCQIKNQPRSYPEQGSAYRFGKVNQQ